MYFLYNLFLCLIDFNTPLVIHGFFNCAAYASFLRNSPLNSYFFSQTQIQHQDHYNCIFYTMPWLVGPHSNVVWFHH